MKLMIFAVSDATGELAMHVAQAGVNQFTNRNMQIVRLPKITSIEQIKPIVLQAKLAQGIIIFTLVAPPMRNELLTLAKREEVQAVDVLGPTLRALESGTHETPSAYPGLQYRLSPEYFLRTEAIEFTVKHDDGQGLSTLHLADIVLLGISRTSKTPLSIYLASHGYKTANVPLVLGLPLPVALKKIPSQKIFGLNIDSERLSHLRHARLDKMHDDQNDTYASLEHVQDELNFSRKIFTNLKATVIDVTGKAIEESASEILTFVELIP